ncbi:MAG: trigger factor [Bacteroidota bacterium]
MPQVVRESIDNLNATITVTVERSDYESTFNEQLKEYRKNAPMKGFRKGKTPLSFIKKLYGQEVLVQVVNQTLQKELTDFLEQGEADFLGQPIPSENQEQYDFNPQDLIDFEFKFDIGLAPQFELQGASESDTYPIYEIEIPKETIDTELKNLLKSKGERKTVTEDIVDGDMIKVRAFELDGDKIKENGVESVFSLLVDRIDSEDVKADVLKKKAGETFDFNIHELESAQSEEQAKKYLLGMNEEQIEEIAVGDYFRGTIEEVNRIVPAELNQDFFDKQFGEGTVSSEEEAREKVKEDILSHYNRQAESLLFRDLQEKLLELNRENMDLPDAFMKRWLTYSDERNTPELVEADYENFADSLRWTIIRNRVETTHKIEITEADVREGFANRIRSYMQGFGDETLIQSTVERLMQDQQQVENVLEEIRSDKVFLALKEQVGLDPKKISVDDFTAEVQRVQEELQAKQAARQAATAATTVEAGEEEE